MKDAEDVVLIEEVLGMTFEVSVNQDGDVVYADFPAWSKANRASSSV